MSIRKMQNQTELSPSSLECVCECVCMCARTLALKVPQQKLEKFLMSNCRSPSCLREEF